MAPWSSVPLGDLLSRHEHQILIEPDTEYRQITVRLWGKGVVLREVIKGSEIAAERQIAVRSGQFIISKIDARHGACGLVPPELDGAVVSQDFPTFDVNDRIILPAYLRWASQTAWFVDLCKRASEGSTNRVRLREDRFLSRTILVPPFEEQRRIVCQLDAVADRIKRHSDLAKMAEDETAGALRKAFSAVISSAPRAPMAEVAPLVRRPVEINPDASYPELGVRSFGKGTFHKPSLTGFEIGTKRLFRIEAGDLLFNIVFAWEGAVAVADHNDAGRVGSHRFLTCVPDPARATPHFIRYYFLTEEGLQELGEASPGGAGRNRTLGIDALAAINVPVPSLDAQLWFDSLQMKAAEIAKCWMKVSDELSALLTSLLNRAFDRSSPQ